MKVKFKKAALELVSKVALDTAKKEANSACMCLGYQPHLPENAEKLKKIK